MIRGEVLRVDAAPGVGCVLGTVGRGGDVAELLEAGAAGGLALADVGEGLELGPRAAGVRA